MLLVRLVRVQTLSYPKTIVFTLCNVNHVVLHDLYLLSRLVSRPKLEMTGGRLEHNRFHSTPKNTLLFLFPATSHIYLFSSCFNDSYTSLSLSQLSCCTAWSFTSLCCRCHCPVLKASDASKSYATIARCHHSTIRPWRRFRYGWRLFLGRGPRAKRQPRQLNDDNVYRNHLFWLYILFIKWGVLFSRWTIH